MIEVGPVTSDEDRDWARALEIDSWGEARVVRMCEAVDPTFLPALVARIEGERVGLLAYALRSDECEVVTIRSLQEGVGIARSLLDAARNIAVAAGCKRLWLVTTNDNIRALTLYQRWGMDLVAVHRWAVEEARRLKPGIPSHGQLGIPIQHELELELVLA